MRAEEISKAIVGQAEVVEGVLMALLAGGHVLLEGAPGLGKTMLVRTLAQAVALKYSRIQFTPDLMPADVIGTSVVQENGDGRKCSIFSPARFHQSAAGGRNQSRDAENAVGAARGHAGKAGDRGAHLAPARRALFRDGHAEPARNGRHLSAARSAARPLPLQDCACRFPGARTCTTFWTAPRRATSRSVRHVVNGPQILEMRQVVRTVPLAPHVQEYVVKLVLATHSGRPRKTCWPANTSATEVRRAARRR